jgi:putative transposase
MLFKNKYRTESTRIKDFDYSSNNWYYVTINTKNFINYFGKVNQKKVILNKLGYVVKEQWLKISDIRTGVELDYFIIMPNHLHGIIIINEATESKKVKTHRDASLLNPICINSLSNIIRGFKSSVTKNIHLLGFDKFNWQPRYYDHIIRNEKDLERIRKYIQINPIKWEFEKANSENIFSN